MSKFIDDGFNREENKDDDDAQERWRLLDRKN